jgi:hypothetical protein
MLLRFACVLALLTAACEAPSFGIATAAVDPCTAQTATGKVCGGACAMCEIGQPCDEATDCASNVCDSGLCADPVPPASCTDGLKNGAETDVDCGGSCPACAVNAHCGSSADCTTLVCSEVCQPANCSDGVRNGSESGIDCGGSCTGCATGQSCTTAQDCLSGSCGKGACLASSCADGVKNGDETDVDCGGSCSPCAAKQGCAKAADCVSLSCAADKQCAAATCTDGIENGTESDIDCGKGCTLCQAGRTCNAASDCASATCRTGYCLPVAATGGDLVRTGWMATASASTSNSTPNDALDGNLTTRWSSGVNQISGMWYELDMQKPQIFFGFALDSSDTPGDAPALFDVYLSLDGTFTTPVLTAQVGMPTSVVTFANAQIARYIKIVLTENKSTNWWGIRELTVSN